MRRSFSLTHFGRSKKPGSTGSRLKSRGPSFASSVNQGVAKHLGPFSTASHELDAGVKWEFVRGAVFELGFVENIVNFDNTPDFGFHAGFTVRF